MALTKTARLELINPYQKFGLKRRPTFDEIVGLVSENDKLIRPFPTREATRFRNSPQGNFFDGSDNLDLLKDQQTRILDRQMRENIMRKEAQQNGGTFHLMRHQEQQTSGLSTPLTSESGFETPSSATSSIYHASSARHLEERVRQEAEKGRQVAQTHQRQVEEMSWSLVNDMVNDAVRISRSKNELPPLEPIPSDDTEEELIPADEPKKMTEKDLPADERRVITGTFNPQTAMEDDNVSSTSLLFQLHFRDKLTDKIIDTVKNTSDEQDNKTYLMGIIFGLIADSDWSVNFTSESRKETINKWIRTRRQFINHQDNKRQVAVAVKASVKA